MTRDWHPDIHLIMHVFASIMLHVCYKNQVVYNLYCAQWQFIRTQFNSLRAGLSY